MKWPITCKDCLNCYEQTLICQQFNKSVADNSVHPWECPKFTPRKETQQLINEIGNCFADSNGG